MADLQIAADLMLALLLAATLFHALRLDRSLRALKRDRAALDGLLGSFEITTRQAEAGLDRLRGMTETTASQMARQSELGKTLTDDLIFLIERGERLADRLDGVVRSAMPLAAQPVRVNDPSPERRQHSEQRATPVDAARVRSQAERDLLQALRAGR